MTDFFDIDSLPPHRGPCWLPVACVLLWPVSIVATAVASAYGHLRRSG